MSTLVMETNIANVAVARKNVDFGELPHVHSLSTTENFAALIPIERNERTR